MSKEFSKSSKIDQSNQLRICHSEGQAFKLFDLVGTIKELEEIHARINENLKKLIAIWTISLISEA